MRKVLLLLLFLLPFFHIIFSQDIEIAGKVMGENGDALPGVNVVVKGTAIGTITDS